MSAKVGLKWPTFRGIDHTSISVCMLYVCIQVSMYFILNGHNTQHSGHTAQNR